MWADNELGGFYKSWTLSVGSEVIKKFEAITLGHTGVKRETWFLGSSSKEIGHLMTVFVHWSDVDSQEQKTLSGKRLVEYWVTLHTSPFCLTAILSAWALEIRLSGRVDAIMKTAQTFHPRGLWFKRCCCQLLIIGPKERYLCSMSFPHLMRLNNYAHFAYFCED